MNLTVQDVLVVHGLNPIFVRVRSYKEYYSKKNLP